MIVTYNLKPNTPLTLEQIKRLDALKDRPIVFDEDCPRNDRGAAQAVQAGASPQGGCWPRPKVRLIPFQSALHRALFSYLEKTQKNAEPDRVY